jgi:hypothetical protein
MNHSIEPAGKLRVWVGVLVLLLFSALFIEGIPVVHTHAAEEPGIYNEQCQLALLAAQGAGAPPAAGVSVAVPLVIVQSADLYESPSLSSPFLPSTPPRGPPTLG